MLITPLPSVSAGCIGSPVALTTEAVRELVESTDTVVELLCPSDVASMTATDTEETAMMARTVTTNRFGLEVCIQKEG